MREDEFHDGFVTFKCINIILYRKETITNIKFPITNSIVGFPQ